MVGRVQENFTYLSADLSASRLPSQKAGSADAFQSLCKELGLSGFATTFDSFEADQETQAARQPSQTITARVSSQEIEGYNRPPMIALENKVALVTGGSRGIGEAIALALAAAGADVAASYLSQREKAEEVVRRIEALGRRAISLQADVAKEEAVKELVDQTVSRLGGLDVLVANAGIWKRASLPEMTPEEWDETLGTNLKGVFLAAKHAARVMIPRKWGRVILISSTSGQRGEAFYSHYSASKGGIISFTKSLALELAPHGVLVNCVAPGWVATDMTAETFASPERAAIEATIPLGRPGEPKEIAGAVVFLASEAASYITGEILNVNGGAVLVG
jgi:3-oxoacyl-[acyl-carrier protein] reductase